jgi:hypothetical protein
MGEAPSMAHRPIHDMGGEGTWTRRSASSSMPSSPAGRSRNAAKGVDPRGIRPPGDERAIKDTAERIAKIRSSPEGREGVAAFLERRASWIPPDPEPVVPEEPPPGI